MYLLHFTICIYSKIYCKLYAAYMAYHLCIAEELTAISEMFNSYEVTKIPSKVFDAKLCSGWLLPSSVDRGLVISRDR